MADNIYMKLQKMRVALQNMNIKKSGRNDFSKYDYYELGDFLPPINQLMLEHKVTSFITFDDVVARLTLVNSEAPEEVIIFTSPMAKAALKGAHEIQNLGAVETYSRRYLYMAAFEIVESDIVDRSPKPEQQQPQKPAKQKSSQLSKDLGNALNKAIKDYANLTGKANGEVVKMVEAAVGKKTKDFVDEDGEAALELLQEWQGKYLDDLGA